MGFPNDSLLLVYCAFFDQDDKGKHCQALHPGSKEVFYMSPESKTPSWHKATQRYPAGKQIAEGHERLYGVDLPQREFPFESGSVPVEDDPR